MRKSLSKCVFQRKNGIFYFRRAVPKDLVSRVGKREWKASLGTRNEQEAHTLAADHFRRTEQRIRVMRGQHLAKEEKTGTQSYTASEVIEFAQKKFSRKATMRVGRLDGRLRSGHYAGDSATQLLQRLEQQLDHMRVSSPWALGDDKNYWDTIAETEAETGHPIEPNSPLEIDIRLQYWEIMRQVSEDTVAQLKGDLEGVRKRRTKDRKPATLKSLLELYEKHKSGNWSPKSRAKFETMSTMLIAILGGDKPLREIDRETAREAGDILHRLPTHFSTRAELRGLSIRDAANRAEQLGLSRLGRRTIKDYYNNFATIFEFAVKEELMDKNPMKGLTIYAPRKETNRQPFDADDLKLIFSAPVFTGCKDDEKHWRVPAKTQIRRGKYWVPIIAFHTGMRLNEICSLRRGDIQSDEGIDFIRVTDSGGRRLKTSNAARIIPIHHQLCELGFLEWVKQQSKDPEADLFPELPIDAGGSRSNAFSKWFTRLRRSVGVTREGRTFHSFRHLFEDRLREARVSLEVNERLMGWSSNHIQRTYGLGPSLAHLNEEMQNVDLSMASLKHLRQS